VRLSHGHWPWSQGTSQPRRQVAKTQLRKLLRQRRHLQQHIRWHLPSVVGARTVSPEAVVPCSEVCPPSDEYCTC
jgi:hypothetical protein